LASWQKVDGKVTRLFSAEVPDDIVALGKYGRHTHRNPILNSAVVSIKPANLDRPD